MNLSHQLSMNSDAVLIFTRCVYCTNIRSIHIRYNSSCSIDNRYAYSLSVIRENLRPCSNLWTADVKGSHLILPLKSSIIFPQILSHILLQQQNKIGNSQLISTISTFGQGWISAAFHCSVQCRAPASSASGLQHRSCVR